jgi:hypothetical protein
MEATMDVDVVVVLEALGKADEELGLGERNWSGENFTGRLGPFNWK